jgi:CheY-like chemotaxis protein
VELKKILYAEDDDDIRSVAVLALEMIGGFVVSACTSGFEAVEKAASFDPDLILLDVMMPGMDGPATLTRLRELPELARVPAVFFTAKAQPSEVERLRALGAQAVLAKPFDPADLSADLRRIWKAVHDE